MLTVQFVVSMLPIGALFIRENWRSFAVELNCSGLVLLLIVLTGCTHHVATTGERAASFAGYSEQPIGMDRMEIFLQQRTAILIGGLPANTTGEIERWGSATGHPGAHSRYATGMATAIDPRGYFLTAGHCVDWQPLHVLMPERDRIRLVPVRTVWRGALSRNEPDLALLHVKENLPAYFAWADDVRTNVTVVGAGADSRKPASFHIECFAGIVFGATESAGPGPAAHSTIDHSAPVRQGDSGGPLATEDGCLIAINVGDVRELHLFTFARTRAGRAQRPDLSWLKATIDHDFSSHTPASSRSP